LVRERVSHVQRIQKVLEDANIKLTNVLSDVTGMSGRRILGAIIEGQTDGRALAELASARVHASKEQLAQALHRSGPTPMDETIPRACARVS
jgi:transposase